MKTGENMGVRTRKQENAECPAICRRMSCNIKASMVVNLFAFPNEHWLTACSHSVVGLSGSQRY
jgi:hypothetical protein